MGNEPDAPRPARRYIRLPGPFEGHHVGPPREPILVYDLNEGGGLVSFIHEQPTASLLELQISLPNEGAITVHAEPVSRQPFGVGVRFVDIDDDTTAKLARAVQMLASADHATEGTRH